MGRLSVVSPFLRNKLNVRKFRKEDVIALRTECGAQFGMVTPSITAVLSQFSQFFNVKPEEIIMKGFTYNERTKNMAIFANDIHSNWADIASKAGMGQTPDLGWRNELYTVYPINETPLKHSQKLFQMERALCKFLGIETYGVHVNCYSIINGEIYIWVGKRSPTKSTFPNKIDQCVAGGVTAGLGLNEVLIKEAEEEASIPAEIAKNAKLTNFVQYCYHKTHHLKRECNFVYDLELPQDFIPKTNDGETTDFQRIKLGKHCSLFDDPEEWKPNCYAITLDFAIRMGQIESSELTDLFDWFYLIRNKELF